MHCPTESQIADALTNGANVDGFLLLRDELGEIQFDEYKVELRENGVSNSTMMVVNIVSCVTILLVLQV